MLDALHFCNDLAQVQLIISSDPKETASSLGIDARYQDINMAQWTTRDAFRGASTTIDSKAYPQATRAQNDNSRRCRSTTARKNRSLMKQLHS